MAVILRESSIRDLLWLVVSTGYSWQNLLTFAQMHRTSKDQKTSRDLVADLMKNQLNNDARLTEKMIPSFDLGCRRMTPGSAYLQSLTKENVQVVTESVVRFTKDGVVDESGTEYKADVVICATGFDVSFTPHFEVIGREKVNLKENFGDNPKAYLSITAPSFPNLFRKFCCSKLLSIWRV
jgi:cation diffusion facilitator CzcD-associated flavoprotein CzcO